ncbi:MAG: hypothetical protein ACRD3L_17495 [Terriglobales bacterium]
MADVFPSTRELMNRRLDLLRQLAGSLELAQAALATTTPAKLELESVRQRELCQGLRALAEAFPEQGRVEADARLADDLQAASGQVAELNRKYAALLRRRRRTVDIFCRVLASSETTYSAPKLPPRLDEEGTRAKG